MAKKKRKKKSRKKKNKNKFKFALAPGVGREIIAILLIAIAFVLLAAFFDAGGSVSASALRGLRFTLGISTYLIPVILAYIAWLIFKSDDEEHLHLQTYIGALLLLVAVSALGHAFIDPVDSQALAEVGEGGGMLGHLILNATTPFLSRVLAGFLYFAAILIGAVLFVNTPLSEVMQAFKKLFSKLNPQKLKTNIGDDVSSAKESVLKKKKKMTINANVPISSKKSKNKDPSATLSTRSTDDEEKEALTSVSDSEWDYPPLDLLSESKSEADPGDHEANAETIRQTLESFGVDVEMEEVNVGPRVTQYAFRPPSGVKLSKITALDNNLALSLAAPSIRIEAPIPGKRAVGVEVPNKSSAIVNLRHMLESDQWRKAKNPLSFTLGQDIGGETVVTELDSMPHVLIAGATGSGKSVMLNSLLLSLLYRNAPSEMQLILVDPKRVELSLYDDIPHLLSPVITEPEKCISALKWAVEEMDRRYEVFAEMGKRNIAEYNKVMKDSGMPYIVIVIDELADMMMLSAKDVEGLVVRLAQKARATGIHLVLATQRPSVNVITGLIKANIPARIAFSTTSQVDSRTILDQIGAEKLLGKGDMLFQTPSLPKPRRIQGVYVSEKEVNAVTDFLKEEREPDYNDEILEQEVSIGSKAGPGTDGQEDELYDDAVEIVVKNQKGSASLLQRRLSVGYARAARLIDGMEEQGIVGPSRGSKAREVLVSGLDEVFEADEETTE